MSASAGPDEQCEQQSWRLSEDRGDSGNVSFDPAGQSSKKPAAERNGFAADRKTRTEPLDDDEGTAEATLIVATTNAQAACEAQLATTQAIAEIELVLEELKERIASESVALVATTRSQELLPGSCEGS